MHLQYQQALHNTDPLLAQMDLSILSEGGRMKARDAKYEAKVHEEERGAQEEQPVPI